MVRLDMQILAEAFYSLNYNHMSIFKDKMLLITGGTGSFGNAVLKRFWIAMSVKYAYLAVMRKTR